MPIDSGTNEQEQEVLNAVKTELDGFNEMLAESKEKNEGLEKDIIALKEEFSAKVDEIEVGLAKDVERHYRPQISPFDNLGMTQEELSDLGNWMMEGPVKNQGKKFDLGMALSITTGPTGGNLTQTALIRSLDRSMLQSGAILRYATVVNSNDGVPHVSQDDTSLGAQWENNDTTVTVADNSAAITYTKSTIVPKPLAISAQASKELIERAAPPISIAANIVENLTGPWGRRLDRTAALGSGVADATNGGFSGFANPAVTTPLATEMQLATPDLDLLFDAVNDVHEQTIEGDPAYYMNRKTKVALRKAKVNSESNHFAWDFLGPIPSLTFAGIPVRDYNQLDHPGEGDSTQGEIVYGDLARAVLLVLGTSASLLFNPFRLANNLLDEWILYRMAGVATVRNDFITVIHTNQ